MWEAWRVCVRGFILRGVDQLRKRDEIVEDAFGWEMRLWQARSGCTLCVVAMMVCDNLSTTRR